MGMVVTCLDQEVANTLWAVATLGHNPGATLLDAASVQILRRIDQFSPQDISNSIWALARLYHHPSSELLQVPHVCPTTGAQGTCLTTLACTFTLRFGTVVLAFTYEQFLSKTCSLLPGSRQCTMFLAGSRTALALGTQNPVCAKPMGRAFAHDVHNHQCASRY
jgi:hypothetical protein